MLGPDVQQFFIPAGGNTPRYAPVALGVAKVTFSDTKLKISETRDVVVASPIGSGAVPVDWAEAETLDLTASDLETAPAEGATFDDLPKAGASGKSYVAWQKSFASWLSSSQKLELMRHAGLKLTSSAGESERDFRIRVHDAQREARDAEVDKVRRKFAAKRAVLEDQIRRAEQAAARESEQASDANRQSAISIGAAVLGGIGSLFGRRSINASTIGRATTAARGVSRISKEKQDVKRAQETVQVKQQALEELDAQIADETTAIAARYDADASNIETISLAPKRGGVLVQSVSLGWKSA